MPLPFPSRAAQKPAGSIVTTIINVVFDGKGKCPASTDLPDIPICRRVVNARVKRGAAIATKDQDSGRWHYGPLAILLPLTLRKKVFTIAGVVKYMSGPGNRSLSRHRHSVTC